MSLAQLNIHNVRNIHAETLSLHPRYNVLYGVNGSGKSSILEAIYLLSSGHSFRTRESAPLIRDGAEALAIFTRTVFEDTISVQKTLTEPTRIQLNHVPCRRTSDLARVLPCQIFHQEIFQILDAGPSVRRMMMDWGLFHVEQSYHDVWKEYRRVIKQRNALLRQRAGEHQFIPWDQLLVDLSHEIDRMRTQYFELWKFEFDRLLKQLTDTPCTIAYYKGWDKRGVGKELGTHLTEQFSSDLQRQYTQSGAHQADVLIQTPISSAKQTLSRGQQKIILIALKLAQTQLISKPCIYLIDDIVAELDRIHLERLGECLKEMDGQFFFTAINEEAIRPILLKNNHTAFHINQGVIGENVQ